MALSLLDVGGSSKKDKKKNTPETFRFHLQLFDPDRKRYPEFDFAQLVKEKTGSSEDVDNPFEGNEEHQRLQLIAKKFQEKYGGGSGRKKKGRSTFGKAEDYLDMGIGYDKEDSFIDDSEAYDELVPSTLETKCKGFYMNAGLLTFVEEEEEEEDEEQPSSSKSPPESSKTNDLPSTPPKNSSPKKPKRNRILSSDEESSEDEEELTLKELAIVTAGSASDSSQQDGKKKNRNGSPEKKKPKLQGLTVEGEKKVEKRGRPRKNKEFNPPVQKQKSSEANAAKKIMKKSLAHGKPKTPQADKQKRVVEDNKRRTDAVNQVLDKINFERTVNANANSPRKIQNTIDDLINTLSNAATDNNMKQMTNNDGSSSRMQGADELLETLGIGALPTSFKDKIPDVTLLDSFLHSIAPSPSNHQMNGNMTKTPVLAEQGRSKGSVMSEPRRMTGQPPKITRNPPLSASPAVLLAEGAISQDLHNAMAEFESLCGGTRDPTKGGKGKVKLGLDHDKMIEKIDNILKSKPQFNQRQRRDVYLTLATMAGCGRENLKQRLKKHLEVKNSAHGTSTVSGISSPQSDNPPTDYVSVSTSSVSEINPKSGSEIKHKPSEGQNDVVSTPSGRPQGTERHNSVTERWMAGSEPSATVVTMERLLREASQAETPEKRRQYEIILKAMIENDAPANVIATEAARVAAKAQSDKIARASPTTANKDQSQVKRTPKTDYTGSSSSKDNPAGEDRNQKNANAGFSIAISHDNRTNSVSRHTTQSTSSPTTKTSTATSLQPLTSEEKLKPSTSNTQQQQLQQQQQQQQRLQYEREKQQKHDRQRALAQQAMLEQQKEKLKQQQQRLQQERENQQRLQKEREKQERDKQQLQQQQRLQQRLQQECENQQRLQKEREKQEQRQKQERDKQQLQQQQRLQQECENQQRLQKEREKQEQRQQQEHEKRQQQQRLQQERDNQQRLQKEREKQEQRQQQERDKQQLQQQQKQQQQEMYTGIEARETEAFERRQHNHINKCIAEAKQKQAALLQRQHSQQELAMKLKQRNLEQAKLQKDNLEREKIKEKQQAELKLKLEGEKAVIKAKLEQEERDVEAKKKEREREYKEAEARIKRRREDMEAEDRKQKQLQAHQSTIERIDRHQGLTKEQVQVQEAARTQLPYQQGHTPTGYGQTRPDQPTKLTLPTVPSGSDLSIIQSNEEQQQQLQRQQQRQQQQRQQRQQQQLQGLGGLSNLPNFASEAALQQTFPASPHSKHSPSPSRLPNHPSPHSSPGVSSTSPSVGGSRKIQPNVHPTHGSQGYATPSSVSGHTPHGTPPRSATFVGSNLSFEEKQLIDSFSQIQHQIVSPTGPNPSGNIPGNTVNPVTSSPLGSGSHRSILSGHDHHSLLTSPYQSPPILPPSPSRHQSPHYPGVNPHQQSPFNLGQQYPAYPGGPIPSSASSWSHRQHQQYPHPSPTSQYRQS